ncbi:Uncharacterized membrane protein YfhO [Lachnospiraceae bacterium]|nr:Uncharacterized membrane protein YfhO [Lachnospiraceae bacterium]
MTKKIDKRVLYVSSFLIPVLLYTIIFALHGIYPFGDNTVMTGDMHYQFIDYLSYLKTIVFGNNDFFYSFSKNMGGGMSGFTAYYYLSPVNLITLLFSSKWLPVAESVVILLTAGMMSLTFIILLNNEYGNYAGNLIFSVGYGMIGFFATYFQLTIYFGNLILFPLIILGLLNLIKDPKNNKLYFVTLFLAILFNYYSGFMICIFCTLFFISRCLIEKESLLTEKRIISVIRSFVLTSAAAGLLTAFSLVPAVLSLSGEKNNLAVGFFRTFSVSQFPGQFLSGSFIGNVSTGLPNVFCGEAAVIFFVLYLLNRRYSKRERLVYAVLFLFLIINMYINTLNVVWHGLNQPIGFPFRYSYMLSFIMLFLGARELVNPDKERILIPVTVITACFAGYLFIERGKIGSASSQMLYINMIIILLCGMLFIAWNFAKDRHMMLIFCMIMSLQLLDLTGNSWSVFKYFKLASLNEYQTYLDKTGRQINAAKEKAAEENVGFYRLEKYYRRTNNDAMQFDYAGLSHFSSSEKKDKINFIGKLGFRNNGNWTFYNEATTKFIDCFLGVRYILSQHDFTYNHYDLVKAEKSCYLFENKEVLPLAFSSTDKILDINYNAYNNDPFALQEAIASALNGKTNDLFHMAEVENVELDNLSEEKTDTGIKYKKVDESKEAWVTWMINVTEDSNLFGYFDAPETQEAELFIDETDTGDYFSTYRWNIVSLDDHTPGEKLRIRMRVDDKSIEITKALFYYEELEHTDRLMNEIGSSDNHIEKITSSHLRGKITVPEDKKLMVMSLPYDTSWKIYVDGKETEMKRAAGMLISFYSGSGEHSIEMKYIPKGMTVGNIISVVVLVILTYHMLWFGRKSKKI